MNTKYAVEKLNGQNCLVWSKQVRLILFSDATRVYSKIHHRFGGAFANPVETLDQGCGLMRCEKFAEMKI